MNLILNTDSYKYSHFLQYPPGTEKVFSYIESRGGEYPESVFFGLQMFLKQYLTTPVTKEDIDEGEDFATGQGLPFHRAGWEHIVNKHGGRLPLMITALKEGTVVPTKNCLVGVINTDNEVPWLTSFIETSILRAIWYPTTVATISWTIKKICRRFLEETSDDLSGLPFMLNDFGARGVSSLESAQIGGLAHLVNFQGTDNVPAVYAARKYYHEKIAGFSVPAAEHSTITSWGRDNEAQAYANMVRSFSKPGSIYAVVSDSYDLFNAVNFIWGEQLKDEVIKRQGRLVIRPDSGHPPEIVLKTVMAVWEKFGGTTNTKGYKVLPPYVRVIQGDGINEHSIAEILQVLKNSGFSAENVVFGMGGALLQHMNRDTMKFAMKCSAINISGVWHHVFKDPATDKGKASKKGLLKTIKSPTGTFVTVDTLTATYPETWEAMSIAYMNGECDLDVSLADIRGLVNGAK